MCLKDSCLLACTLHRDLLLQVRLLQARHACLQRYLALCLHHSSCALTLGPQMEKDILEKIRQLLFSILAIWNASSKPKVWSLKLLIIALGKRAREDMAEAGEILENAQMSDIYRARAKQRNRIWCSAKLSPDLHCIFESRNRSCFVNLLSSLRTYLYWSIAFYWMPYRWDCTLEWQSSSERTWMYFHSSMRLLVEALPSIDDYWWWQLSRPKIPSCPLTSEFQLALDLICIKLTQAENSEGQFQLLQLPASGIQERLQL